MTEENPSDNHSGKTATPPLIPLMEMGKKRLDAVVGAQTEFLGRLQEVNQDLLARAQTEAEFISELVGKLTAARSLPEAAAVYQDWVSQHIQMLAEDGRRFMIEGQRFMQVGARAFQ
jgi:hypothetical protein